MSHRSDRLAVLQALAEFELGCRAFAHGVARLRLQPRDPALQAIIEELGEPRPAVRARPATTTRARRRRFR